MSKNTCPICGKALDDSSAILLDNGSPAHPKCVELDEEHKKEKEKETEKNG